MFLNFSENFPGISLQIALYTLINLFLKLDIVSLDHSLNILNDKFGSFLNLVMELGTLNFEFHFIIIIKMSSEKRRARFEKANINFSREMRIRKDSELSKSLEKRNKSQTRIE